MYIGSYDDEATTLQAMEDFTSNNGYKTDITPQRFYHEIYLSDPRKCDITKLKTVLRQAIKKRD